MTERELELALRKQRLILRSAALRVLMTREAGHLKPAFARADQVRNALVWVRDHLHVVAAAGATLMVIRPRALFRWSRRGYFVWKAWRSLRSRIPTP